VKNFLTILAIVIFAFFIFAFKGHWARKRQKRFYANIQSGRTPLTNEAFCEKLGIDLSFAEAVSILRTKIAGLGCYDPLRIYPDDEFYSHFGLNYDDDAAMFLQETKIIKAYRGYSFPLEEVKTIGDFVKVVLRLKKESEETNISQT
jgi:hypothetical protein